MPEIFTYLFLIGLFLHELIRYPHRQRNTHDREQHRMRDERGLQAAEVGINLFALVGMELLPLFYGFTNWLDFANYSLPQVFGWLGLPFIIGSVWLLWRAHHDLGRNWSPTLEIGSDHSLVTHGIYAYLRHPIYTSLWLAALAQFLMLSNWIAGPVGLLSVLLIQAVRIPHEEQMMIEHFGPSYREYMKQVGGVLPHWRQVIRRSA